MTMTVSYHNIRYVLNLRIEQSINCGKMQFDLKAILAIARKVIIVIVTAVITSGNAV